MKPTHKLFFAIPFDAATRTQYDRIASVVRRRFPSVTTVIGNVHVGPSPAYADISSFKAQNRELAAQFIAQIRDADVVIADLTHNNPNVHVELGIALMENKNVLRVTGRSMSDLGFDIRNLEVQSYKSESDLIRTITTYLETFFRIKRLPISKKYGPLYFRHANLLKLDGLNSQFGLDAKRATTTRHSMRDGALQVTFEITQARSTNDWFGVYFRAGEAPLLGSHLLYVRQNGNVEAAVYPGPRVIQTASMGRAISGKQILRVEFENNYLTARIGRAQLRTDKLSYQAVGEVLVAAWYAEATVHGVEMICRDTIEW